MENAHTCNLFCSLELIIKKIEVPLFPSHVLKKKKKSAADEVTFSKMTDSFTFQNRCTLTSAVWAFAEIVLCDLNIIRCLTGGMRGRVEVQHLRGESRCSVSESLMPITAVTHLLCACSETWTE